ncbi:MAG: aldolase [Tannerella sp.]|jgi:4-hydroxy-2-oxoheptanedioate aldolase|nr:aldolase [Tannerella sp.]
MKHLTDIICDKGFVIGPFMKSSDPALVEIAGCAGFDFVVLDMEHGSVGLQQMQNMIRSAVLSNVIPVIRTRDQEAESISQALDIGASAIQIPQIKTVEDAVSVVEAAKFYPMGNRGVCRFVRAANYSGMERTQYFKEANKTSIIIQIEGLEAIDNFDKIIEVKGVDILFIGPYDLSQSMGVPGEIDHPKVVEKITELILKANKANKYIGIFTDTLENALLWKKTGVHYLSYSVDMGLYLSACKNVVEQIRFSD